MALRIVSAPPTNGLIWGVVVDVGGDGFALGDEAYRSGFEVETPSGVLGMPQVVEIVPTSTSLSGDMLVIPSTSTLDSSPFGGTGTITTSFVPFENGIATDAAFAIFWFDVVQMSNQSVAEGTSFGILEDPLFTIPEAGFTVDYAAVFGSLSGPFPASSGTFGPVPEPTTPVLLTAATAALALRRRRTDRLSQSAQTC